MCIHKIKDYTIRTQETNANPVMAPKIFVRDKLLLILSTGAFPSNHFFLAYGASSLILSPSPLVASITESLLLFAAVET